MELCSSAFNSYKIIPVGRLSVEELAQYFTDKSETLHT